MLSRVSQHGSLFFRRQLLMDVSVAATDAVWERLAAVDGDTLLVDAAFRPARGTPVVAAAPAAALARCGQRA